MLSVYFVTSNAEKIKELQEVQRHENDIVITGLPCNDLPEILGTTNTELIESKALAAFTRFRMPVLVDHASLSIHRFRGLPGPASKPFWNAIGTELYDILSRLATDVGDQEVYKATVRVDVAYCDQRQLISDFHEVAGRIVSPSGGRFDWDQCFSPNGAINGQPYAAMAPETKFKYSARSKAVEKLFSRLSSDLWL